jgi:exodeoxyribonuclease V alpha subunit
VNAVEPSSVDRALGRALGRGDALVEALVTLTSHALGEGHVCLPLDSPDVLASLRALLPDAPAFAGLVEALRRHRAVRVTVGLAPRPQPVAVEAWGDGELPGPPAGQRMLFGTPRVARPLVLDPAGRLYLARYYEHEQGLARAVARLVRARGAGAEASLGPSATTGLDGDQARALKSALAGGLTIVSGGPGTGKTSTVVRILAAHFERALREQAPFPRVLLLAPTGKAAVRLSESILAAKRHLEASPEVVQALPEQGSTIHRALGVLAGSRTRFRHGPGYPLDADIVVVDEASMVDLALMRHLVDALPPRASLLLLGDRDQLSSVDAGNVLAELCDALESDPARARGALRQLTRSHRFDAGGLAAFAAAARAGDAALVKDALSSRAGGVVLSQCSEPKEDETLQQLCLAAFRQVVGAADVATALGRLGAFRVLCAHRTGPFGVLAVNQMVQELLVQKHGLTAVHEYFHGRPILVTETDPVLELMNGDVGLVWSVAGGTPSVFFDRPGRTPLAVSPAHLPGHETAFAMTIHKSQGSEFDHVAVVLPPAQSPLATRELLYTAITRARSRVTLLGDPVALEVGLARQVRRASGLSAAILDWMAGTEP